MRKLVLTAALAATAFGTAAVAQEKTIGVSIPAADHGWTGGVVYHAERVAAAIMAEHPGSKVIVKTSPDPASQANALQDRAPSQNDDTVRDLYVAGNNFALGEVAGKYIAAQSPEAQVVVIRGMPIPIDEERQKGFDKGIEGSKVTVLDRQFGNWNRDDAFKVMQDYLTKFPKIDVVWCQDDDMAVGVLQAIEQAGRTDIQYVVAGAGSKDMIKKVMDGDKMIPVDVLYPPAMVGTAMELTAAAIFDQVPVRGTYVLDATLVTKDNAAQYYFPDSPF